MTTIRIEEWRWCWQVKMMGHADLEAHGKDILCASLSTYAYLLRDVIELLDKEGLLERHFIEFRPGDVTMSVCPKDEAHGIVKTVIQALCRGFKTLRKQYPEAIDFKKRKGVLYE